MVNLTPQVLYHRERTPVPTEYGLVVPQDLSERYGEHRIPGPYRNSNPLSLYWLLSRLPLKCKNKLFVVFYLEKDKIIYYFFSPIVTLNIYLFMLPVTTVAVSQAIWGIIVGLPANNKF